MASHPIRAFDYVNHPYEAVRDAVQGDAAGLFRRATRVAEARSGEIVASLSVDISGVKLSKDVAIQVGAMREEGRLFSRVTHIALEWQAADAPGLFPTLKGELRVYPLSASETQIDLQGEYEPPLGALGGAIDAVVGHRIADAAVHSFVRAVVERLRQDVSS